jgi:hypothetical protein
MYGPNTQLCSLNFDGVRISESPSPAVPFRCVNADMVCLLNCKWQYVSHYAVQLCWERVLIAYDGSCCG